MDVEAKARELAVDVGECYGREWTPSVVCLLTAALRDARNAGAAEAEPRLAIAMQAIGVCSALASYGEGLLGEMVEHARGRARAVMAEWEALEKHGR